MDGLDDQAEATLSSIVESLYTHETVQVKHSSRDLILRGVTQALRLPSDRPIVARRLVLRSGISIEAIGWLEDALRNRHGNQDEEEQRQQQQHHNIDELEICSLQDTLVLRRVFGCCYRCGIRKLVLTSFLSYQPGRHVTVSQILRNGLLLNTKRNVEEDKSRILEDLELLLNAPDDPIQSSFGGGGCLEHLEVQNYPIGVKGTRILAEGPVVATVGLKSLKLLDCDIRSDSATDLAALIQGSPQLQILDLSHNRQFRSRLTREMTLKTIVKRGLRDNLSLLRLHLHGFDDDIDRSRLDQHLDINRLLADFQTNKQDKRVFDLPPGLWCELLARVSVKPAALHFFLQQCTAILGLNRSLTRRGVTASRMIRPEGMTSN